uniref:Putative secreted protein n=1 Tax=Anopheles triannulatus TaxID=58253 RepID=A0A2M4B5U4_9DIPT
MMSLLEAVRFVCCCCTCGNCTCTCCVCEGGGGGDIRSFALTSTPLPPTAPLVAAFVVRPVSLCSITMLAGYSTPDG